MSVNPESRFIDFRTVFNAMPDTSGLVLPDSPNFTVVASTDNFAAFAGVPKDVLIGSSLFTYFPDNPEAPNVSGDIRKSLAICIAEKRKNELAVQRYDIAQTDGSFREMYWTVIHTPILDSDGTVQYIIHTAIDVTERILADRKDERIRSLEPAHNLFMQSVLAINILKGPNLIITLANDPALQLWGKDNSVIGKPLSEVLPEFVEQQFQDLVREAYATGKTQRAFEIPYTLNRNGNSEQLHFNIIVQPYFETSGDKPTGVVVMMNDVTRVHTDRKLFAEKERSLELAVEIGELGVFTIDLQHQMMSISHQIREWLGVAESKLSLSELIKVVHPEDYASIFNVLGEISEGPRHSRHNITFRITHPVTGEIHYLRSIGQLQDDDGEAATLTGIIQDISSSVRSRLALEESAQRLRSFIESAPFPIGVYIGKEMRIEMVNQAILDAWGRDESVLGRTYAEVLPELEGQNIYEKLDEVYTTGQPYHARNSGVDLEVDGKLQTYYFNYSFTPLFNADGSVYGVMNTAAEVTELVVAQMALKESERNFRTMIVQSPVAMCMLYGPDLVVEIANQAMITLWGKEEDQVMHKPIFDGLPDAREQGLEEMLSQVYNQGETVKANEMPVNLIRSGKPDTVYLNFVYEPYRDGSGKITGVLAIAIDVTAQVVARHQIEKVVKERTKELEQTNNSLQKSNAELEQFAYIASHDLQEPLRKINMFTDLLQSSIVDPNERATRHMQSISSSAKRMTKLVTDILQYSQLSQTQDSFTPTDLNDIFEDVMADFDFIVEEKHARIVPHNLPALEAIPLQMVQLFHNLISNSLKYSRADVAPVIHISGAKLSVEDAKKLGLSKRRSYVSISFSDNGIGFSQVYADKIFSIFQRLHGRGQYEGTGIGLAMCRKIAENHGGIIYANGREGEGAEFVVVLPAAQDK
ncbi:MAG TPA: PAS domain-containing protein [Flavobacterium sp.]|jgi:hypothetical protein